MDSGGAGVGLPRYRDVRHVGSFPSESWTSDHCRSRPYEDIRIPRSPFMQIGKTEGGSGLLLSILVRCSASPNEQARGVNHEQYRERHRDEWSHGRLRSEKTLAQ